MQDERDDFVRLGPAGERATALAVEGRSTRRAEEVEEGEFELLPRGVGAVVDFGLELLRERFAVAVGLAFCLWLPVQAFTAFVATDPETMIGRDPSDVVYVMLSSGLSSIATGLMNLLTSALTARLLFEAFEGRRTSALSVLRATLGRLPGLVVIGIVGSVVLVAGFCVFFFGVFGAMWMIAPMAYVYVLEDSTMGNAIQRGFQLSFARLFSWPAFFAFWRWAGITIVQVLLISPFSSLAALAVTPQARAWVLEHAAVSYAAYAWISIVIGALFLAVGTSIQAGIVTAYYLDLRVRRDGLDLDRWQRRVAGARATDTGVALS